MVDKKTVFCVFFYGEWDLDSELNAELMVVIRDAKQRLHARIVLVSVFYPNLFIINRARNHQYCRLQWCSIIFLLLGSCTTRIFSPLPLSLSLLQFHTGHVTAVFAED